MRRIGGPFGYTGTSQVRVLPGRGGEWRVEGPSGVHATCPTRADAERSAEELLGLIGGGEVLIYDAPQRLRAVKRFTAGGPEGA